MTAEAIQEQIDTIRRVTAKILQSKEATLEFLISAGILEVEDEQQTDSSDQNEEK